MKTPNRPIYTTRSPERASLLARELASVSRLTIRLERAGKVYRLHPQHTSLPLHIRKGLRETAVGIVKLRRIG